NNRKQIARGSHNFHDAYGNLRWGRSKGAINSPSWAVITLPFSEQTSLWNAFTNPNINGTSYPMIQRGVSPQVTTHNQIRTQFRDTGTMKAPVPLYICPSRRDTSNQLSETYVVPGSSNSSEGICGDYGVDYGSGTSSTNGNDGSFRWNVDIGIGMKLTDITDGTSNTFLLGEKHVQPENMGKSDFGDFTIYSAPTWDQH